jgi:hypothetical protein
VFFDVRLGANTFSTKSTRLRRSSDPADEKTVEDGTDQAVTAALIQKRLKEFGVAREVNGGSISG